jgi:hypothetical protein
VPSAYIQSDFDTYLDDKNDSIIKSVEDFFYDDPDLPWQALPEHTLEHSPCYPIIERDKNGKIYYCKLHPNIWNINLESIEHHCKYKEPGEHKTEILKLILLKPESHIL